MKDKVNILLLGSGGRECAMARKLTLSPRLDRLYVAPGNAAAYGTRVPDLSPMDFPAVDEFCRSHSIDMILVGPEDPLVHGIADYFADSPVKVIGPCKAGARLEGSKEFAKEFMFSHAIPTARFMSVCTETLEQGLHFLESLRPPYVLKADGLAAGKGVLILDSLADAKDSLAEMLSGMFGGASSTVVIEEYLHGIECSVFVVTDGEDYKVLPVAKDYKRIGEGDTGPNTGGMGAVSPVPFADAEFMAKVTSRIIEPTVQGLREDGIPYKGFIFIGLMNVQGDPYVIEYNVRMGDPETEVVMPRLQSDLIDLLEGVADSTLSLKQVQTDPRAAVAVMLVSQGYPGAYPKGKPMTIPAMPEGVTVFHAGTESDGHGGVVTAGGRVIAVTAYGPDIARAAEKAQQAAAAIEYEGRFFRRDIARDLL